MIKIYIIITFSILYLNFTYAISKTLLDIDIEEGSAFAKDYPFTLLGIMFFIMGSYTFFLIIPILHNNYFELLFLLPVILISTPFIISNFSKFIEYFSHGIIHPCKKCNKLIFKGDYCNKCKEEILKEKI